MAPAALAASVSPAAAALAPGGGVRPARIASLATRNSTKTVLPPKNDLLRSARQRRRLAARSSTSSPSETSTGDSQSPKQEKAPFGYTRKDVLLIGLGVTAFGVGLKYGLELVGVDPLQAGNVVQLLVVLGMTVGWISTYMFRVANKDMTYAQQLRDYEKQVMEKRLESLSEAELQALLEQVEEEKQRLPQIPEEPNAITFKKK
ncbi:hypothetical protein GQ55_5G122800 [Panicum hallii var. hallii]|uniref:Uncharacterized protein n=2 Tax=Panicum hallii TaxID=206008 RepID=A0A2T7DFG7_9POAL|nr:uncharacterized protein LOC112893729 [Panicum hallii]PAN27960.1 hypothetical protein PAHAL_5G120800 [Panicum hallii]PUZ54330.1 hypothetical protein GQ55_5G122800 [Panicum hallii var. hallii]